MEQEKPAEGKVVATKNCNEILFEPIPGNSAVRMQCQTATVDHDIGANHLNVEYRVPTDQKWHARGSARKGFYQCETHVPNSMRRNMKGRDHRWL